jgi:predicted DNA-binding protein (MmcQ/YjbR family)
MPSHIDWLREFCLSLPHTTEDIQWECLLFRIARKIYCTVPLEPHSVTKLGFKCTPQEFTELVEVEGIIPAPYMARNHWVALVDMNALRRDELKERIRNSYTLVLQKLPKKIQAELTQPANVQASTQSGRKKSAPTRSAANRT